MTTTTELRAFTLFRELLELEEGERAARLAEATRDDPRLREQVERLLAADADAAGEAAPLSEERLTRQRGRLESLYVLGHELLPDTVPGYVLGEPLGTGGMGQVHAATTLDGGRPVAIKFLRPETATASSAARFERESALLERLDHPGIARILGHGTVETPAGPRPYLILERVDGQPLDRAARELSREERVELMARVADAVQAAHEAGVVHRDLKPSNVLVDGGGEPHVLDFGIARALRGGGDEQSVTEVTELTRTGQLVGTLGYMSPEQTAGAASVDARTDVYSLGVLLYQVLSGRMPLELRDCPLAEAARRVQDVEPLPLGRLDAGLAGDLEVIATRALEKDPRDRYPSAAALADDLRRHLAHLSILAQPPTALERVRKFARKNRAAVGVGVGSFVVLFAISIVAVVLAIGEARARADTEELLRIQRLRSASDAALQGNLPSYEQAIAPIRAAPGASAWELGVLEHEMRGDTLFLGTTVSSTPCADGAGGRIFVGARDEHLVLVFDDRTGEELARLEVPGSPFQVEATPDGEELLVAVNRTEENGVFHVDVASGETRRLSTGGSFWAASPIAVSPDGRFGAAGTPTGELVLWDLTTLERVWTRHPFPGGCACLLFVEHPDGLAVLVGASAPDPDRLGLWSAATGEPLFPLEQGASGVLDLALSRDQRTAAVSTQDGRIGIRDLHDGRLLAEAAFDGPVSRILFDEGRGRVWGFDEVRKGGLVALDLASGNPVPPADLPPTEEPVPSAALSPDGTFLAAGHPAGTVSIWTRDEDAWRRVERKTGHSDVVRVRFLEDGRLLTLAGGEAPRVRPVTDPPARVLRRAGYVYEVDFSPDGRTLLAGDWSGTLTQVDAETLEVRSARAAHGMVVAEAAWLDDERFVTASRDRTSVVWTRNAEGVAEPGLRFEGQASWLYAVVAYGEDVLTSSSDGRIVRWSPETGEIRASWETGMYEVQGLDVHPDGRHFASVGLGGVMYWSGPGELAWRYSMREKHRAVDHSPDGRWLAVASDDRNVYVFETATGTLVHTLTDHDEPVYAAAFHPDGTRLATGSRDGRIHVWDVATWTRTIVLARHEGYVHDLAWSPDGTLLASGSGDGTVRLWSSRALGR